MTAVRAARFGDVPAWYAPAGIGLAALSGATLIGRPTGLGLSLILEALLAAAAAAAPRHDRWTTAWWWLAALLALTPLFRTAGWVVALAVAGTLGLAAVAAGAVSTWRQLTTVALGWIAGLFPGPFVLAGLAGRHRSSAVIRGLALAALLILVFGALFAAADAAFNQLIDDLVPPVGDDAGARLAVAILVAAVSGALVLVTALPAPGDATEPAARVGRTETTIALAALIALFAVFVTVQAAALFGGDAFVQRTAGLSYADYARQGFGLLLVVAALTLAVVGLAARYGTAHRLLLAALCLLTLVVLGSAWHRLDLYVDAYGATRARFSAGWCIAWLTGLFVLVLVPRSRAVLPRAVVTWSAVLGVAFGVSNPDARIAAGAADRPYERSLSADARGCVRAERDLWSFTVRC